MSSQEAAEPTDFPFKIETSEANKVLPCLQRMIVRSLMHDKDSLGELPIDDRLDALLAQGEPYADKVTDILRPKGFHGSIVGATIMVGSVTFDEAQQLSLTGKSAFRYGMRMDVHATETNSSARKEAGSFVGSLLYATLGYKKPESALLPPELWVARISFPVKRKVIIAPVWDDGSAFDEHLQQLARMKSPDISASRRGTGRARRFPKHK